MRWPTGESPICPAPEGSTARHRADSARSAAIVRGVSFEVRAEAYGRFTGRHSEPLAAQFEAFAGVTPRQHALDVGCGTGALTSELVRRLGVEAVSAVDPSEAFV